MLIVNFLQSYTIFVKQLFNHATYLLLLQIFFNPFFTRNENIY